MKYRITKLFVFLLITLFIFTAFAISISAFSIDPNAQILHDGTIKSFGTLSSAIDAAVSGDVVMLAGEVSDLTVTEGLTITKDITFMTGKDFGGNNKYVEYTGKSSPLFTVESGAVLTITDAQIIGNNNESLLSGGCIYVKKGGTLVLDGKEDAEVLIKSFKLTAKKSKGGAIYCEKGGKIVVNGVTFYDNYASKCNDIFSEGKKDVTIADGVKVNDYNENKRTVTAFEIIIIIVAVVVIFAMLALIIVKIKKWKRKRRHFLYR